MACVRHGIARLKDREIKKNVKEMKEQGKTQKGRSSALEHQEV
jgi:hypothetical protein